MTFHRHLATQQRVVGAIDHAHSTTTQLGGDLVTAAEFLADHDPAPVAMCGRAAKRSNGLAAGAAVSRELVDDHERSAAKRNRGVRVDHLVRLRDLRGSRR